MKTPSPDHDDDATVIKPQSASRPQAFDDDPTVPRSPSLTENPTVDHTVISARRNVKAPGSPRTDGAAIPDATDRIERYGTRRGRAIQAQHQDFEIPAARRRTSVPPLAERVTSRRRPAIRWRLMLVVACIGIAVVIPIVLNAA